MRKTYSNKKTIIRTNKNKKIKKNYKMKKNKKKFERGQQKSRHPPHRGAPVVHFPHFASASLKTPKNGLYAGMRFAYSFAPVL